MNQEQAAALHAGLAALVDDLDRFARERFETVKNDCMGFDDQLDRALMVVALDLGKTLLSLKKAKNTPYKIVDRERTIRDLIGAGALPKDIDALDGRFDKTPRPPAPAVINERPEPVKSHWQESAEVLMAEEFAGNVIAERDFLREVTGLRNVRPDKLTDLQWERVFSAISERRI